MPIIPADVPGAPTLAEMKRTAAFLCTLALAGTIQSQPVKRVLVEESSYALCSQCPEGAWWLDSLLREFPSVIGVSHHIYMDSMTIPESEAWAADFVAGAPLACFDRVDFGLDGFVGEAVPSWRNRLLQRLSEPGYARIDISGAWHQSSGLLNIVVEVTFDSVPDSIAPLQIGFIVVEDSVIGTGPGYDQLNAYNTLVGHPFYGAGDPIVNYAHRHVVRSLRMSPSLIEFPIAPQSVVSATFTDTLSPQWDPEQTSVVGFIAYSHTDITKRHVVNAEQLNLSQLSPTGADEIYDMAVSVIPNPVARGSGFVIHGPQQGDLLILNSLGQVCHRSVVRSETADVPGLDAGVYIVSFCGQVCKLVVQ
jgi:hypothetical protein